MRKSGKDAKAAPSMGSALHTLLSGSLYRGSISTRVKFCTTIINVISSSGACYSNFIISFIAVMPHPDRQQVEECSTSNESLSLSPRSTRQKNTCKEKRKEKKQPLNMGTGSYLSCLP
jgi:hypothetical protein